MGRQRSPEFRATQEWDDGACIKCFAQRCLSTSTRAVLISVGGLFQVAMVLCERHQRLLEDESEQPCRARGCVRGWHQDGPHLAEEGLVFTTRRGPPGAPPRLLEPTA